MNPRPKPPRKLTRGGTSADAQAASWVARRDAGLSAAEAAELAAWRTADPSHEAALQRFAALSDAFQRARQCGAMSDIKSGLQQRAHARQVRRVVLGGTAIALLLIFGVRARLPSEAVPATRAAAIEYGATTRRLPDGSTVELNAGATLAIHFDATARRVELRGGEALFQVAHDSHHPFIVRAGEVDVRAVGTAFAVRVDPQQVEVLVTEGKVGLNAAVGGRSLLAEEPGTGPLPLVAGKWARVAAAHPAVAEVADISAAELKQRLAWRRPRIQFDDSSLASAVQEMNARNSLHIELGDDRVGQLRISGSFSATDPRKFAQLAATTFGLAVEERNGTLILREP